MYSIGNENQLIVVDMADLLVDYCSVQQDIDESKVKASQLVAQTIDLERIIGDTGLSRCIDPQDTEDESLKKLVVVPLVFYTYARMLKMHQGVFTDGGYITEGDDKRTASSVSKEHYAIAEKYMEKVVKFLNTEGKIDPKEENFTPRIRIFGGKEHRDINGW